MDTVCGTTRVLRRRGMYWMPPLRGGSDTQNHEVVNAVVSGNVVASGKRQAVWWSLFRRKEEKDELLEGEEEEENLETLAGSSSDSDHHRGGALTLTKKSQPPSNKLSFVAPLMRDPTARGVLVDPLQILTDQGDESMVEDENQTTRTATGISPDDDARKERRRWWERPWLLGKYRTKRIFLAKDLDGDNISMSAVNEEVNNVNNQDEDSTVVVIENLTEVVAITPLYNVTSHVESLSVEEKQATVSALAQYGERGDEALRHEPPRVVNMSSILVGLPTRNSNISPYISSGYWTLIDNTLTFGYARTHSGWRMSRALRSIRKKVANVTGLHGIVSRKGCVDGPYKLFQVQSGNTTMHTIRRKIAAIDQLRPQGKRRGHFWRRQRQAKLDSEPTYAFTVEKESDGDWEELRRARVRDIDQMFRKCQRRLFELACEKDVLQERPNPLWNYTSDLSQHARNGAIDATREFAFPSKLLVDEYLASLISSGRLIKLNHTDLWRNGGGEDEEISDDDEWLSSSSEEFEVDRKRRDSNKQSSGNWLLRNGLGEKIGAAAETAAYKAVCHSIMSVLARSLSGLHGLNIMEHSDVRLSMEETPELPPVYDVGLRGKVGTSSYAQGALHEAMRRGSRKAKKRRKWHGDDSFIQRDAVVETLLSHCQISAPLLKLFPLAWQRAILGNIISLVTFVMSDFFEGLEFQILGHRLSFSFTPITEEDMLRRIGTQGHDSLRRRDSLEQFEVAVTRTARDLSENLIFLDRWHERALGSGVLRSQIATLIARLVLTLVDEVLSSARVDLWSAHASGPRLIAGLEYRTLAQPVES